MLTRASLDYLNQIAFVDYNLVYRAQTVVHLQLYSWGLLHRIETFAPGTAIEYVPGVVHFPIAVYQRYLSDNPWRRMLETLSPTLSFALAAQLRTSVWRVIRWAHRFEKGESPALNPLLDAVAGMMQFSSIEEEFNLEAWLESRLRIAGLPQTVFHQISRPQVTPYS